LEKEIQKKHIRENKITLITLKEENNVILQNLLNESREFFKTIFRNSNESKKSYLNLDLIPQIKYDLKKFVIEN
jgi:hypothetical protein